MTVSFAVQKLFSLMQSHLFILSLRCSDFWVLFRKLLPIPFCSSLFLTISCSCFNDSGLMLMSLIHFQLILVQDERQESSFSLLHIYISSFLSSVCWTGWLFSVVCFGLLCGRLVGYRCVGLCLGLLFWFIGFPECFCADTMLFLLLWLCSIVCNFIHPFFVFYLSSFNFLFTSSF
jgi:hypothetical protein